MNRRPRILFVCVENSNRSQIAEAFARIHGGSDVEAYSAGSRPSGKINPRAIESMNEATQLYVIASEILGPPPQRIPPQARPPLESFNELEAAFDDFTNALVEVENLVPPLPGNGPAGADPAPLPMLYFCIPQNDQLLAYWDTVADRLFKIHNSLNLQGIFQSLPLYDPPIDPALLVRAAASGLDVSAVVSGLNQPLPLVRFQFLIGKATEICQEVKSLGAELLAAIEKGDNESISLLRSLHESAILGLTNVVKYTQWQEAIKARDSALAALRLITNSNLVGC